MNSSYRIFRVFNISVELHITFIIFLLLMFALGIANVIFWLSIFAIVLLHELIHSLVAMGFGIPVPRIVLTPIGGIASIEVPEDPKKELLISISGPMSNFALAAVIYSFIAFTGINLLSYSLVIRLLSTGAADITDPSIILSGMLWVNIVLGLFNAIPGFPMDGGRVFRAVLSLWVNYITATKIAVLVGQITALLMIVAGFFFNPWLIIIGIFLYSAGSSELEVVKIKHAIGGLTLSEIAVKNFGYVNESTTVSDFLRMIAKPNQSHYPVSDQGGKIVGLLHLDDLKDISDDNIHRIEVKDLMKKRFDVVNAKSMVSESLGRILGREFILVVDADKVIGYITPEVVFSSARFHNIINKGTTQR